MILNLKRKQFKLKPVWAKNSWIMYIEMIDVLFLNDIFAERAYKPTRISLMIYS